MTLALLGCDTCRADKARIFLRRPIAVRIRIRPGTPLATPPRPFSWSFRGRTANRRNFPRSAGRIRGRSCDRGRPRRRNIYRRDNALCNPPRYARRGRWSRWDDRQSPGRNCISVARIRSGRCPPGKTRTASSPHHSKCQPRTVLRK